MRECGGCTLCCDLIAVPALKKAAGEACVHCVKSFGCTIHESRPAQCRGFDCLWLTEKSLPKALWPSLCGVFFEPFWAEHMVVAAVDPARPEAWRDEVPMGMIQQMLVDGFVVWVMVGKDRHLVLPAGVNEDEGRERAQRAWERKWQRQLTPQT